MLLDMDSDVNAETFFCEVWPLDSMAPLPAIRYAN